MANLPEPFGRRQSPVVARKPKMPILMTSGGGSTSFGSNGYFEFPPSSLAKESNRHRVIRIVSGVLEGGEYDAVIEARANEVWEDDILPHIWALDLSGSSSMKPGTVLRNAFYIRDELGGSYYVSKWPVVNAGNPLSDTNFWTKVVGSIIPRAYNVLTPYVVGNLVEYGGAIYLCIANNTGQSLGNDLYWVLLINGVLDAGGYNPESLYSSGWMVREYRQLFTFESDLISSTSLGSPVFFGIARGTITAASSSYIVVATLAANLLDTDETISLSNVLAIPEGILTSLLIDFEEIMVVRTNLTIAIQCRGAYGTTIVATHTSGTVVRRHHLANGSGYVHVIGASVQEDGTYDNTDTGNDQFVINSCDQIANGSFVMGFIEPNSDPKQYRVVNLCSAPVPSGSGSGGSPCGGCSNLADCYSITLTGITNATPPYPSYGCNFCAEALTGTFNLTKAFSVSYDCFWEHTFDPVSPCVSAVPWTVSFGYNSFAGKWVLFFQGLGATQAYYTADTWDCTSDLVLTKISAGILICDNWPTTITLTTCSGGGTSAPTVDLSTASICQDATIIVITGTGFDTIPANNTVTFNLGASGTCTSATSTSMTVTFTVNPTSTGNLTAVVENANGSSTPAVQVGTVIDCVSAVWSDLFADTDNTLIDSHTPDVGTGGYTSSGTDKFRIYNPAGQNKLGHDLTADTGPIASFSPAWASSKLTVDFVFVDSLEFTITLRPRNGYPIAADLYSDGLGAGDCVLDVADGVGAPTSDTLTLVNGNTYTITVINLPGSISITVNGVTVTRTTAVNYGSGVWHIGVFTPVSTPADTILLDNLKVTAWA